VQEASTATSVTPRLISVVEVIKREFIKNLEKDRSPRLKGLHQYNEILTLEKLGVTLRPPRAKEDQENSAQREETARSQQILQALSGRHQLVSFVLTTLPPFTLFLFHEARDKHNPHFYGLPFHWLSSRIYCYVVQRAFPL
jgi:hypothetical protein